MHRLPLLVPLLWRSCRFYFPMCRTPAGLFSLLSPLCPGLSSLCAHPVARHSPPPPAPSVRPLLCRVFLLLFLVVFLRLCRVVFVVLVFFNPPLCMHARHGNTGLLLLRLLSCLFSSPLAPVGLSLWRSPAMPGGRPSLVSPPLRSLQRPTVCRAPPALAPPYCSSPASCALCCTSPRHACIFLAHTRRSAGAWSASR